MPLLSSPAIYDGKELRLLESVPCSEPYRVVATFVAPVTAGKTDEPELSRCWASFGAWQDETPAETIIETIYKVLALGLNDRIYNHQLFA